MTTFSTLFVSICLHYPSSLQDSKCLEKEYALFIFACQIKGLYKIRCLVNLCETINQFIKNEHSDTLLLCFKSLGTNTYHQESEKIPTELVFVVVVNHLLQAMYL